MTAEAHNNKKRKENLLENLMEKMGAKLFLFIKES